jgi:DNA-binding MarR family transcriptional regulator
LQEAAVVERRPDPTDRRAWRLFLTDKGNQMINQLRPLALETLETALDGVADAHRDEMMVALDRMRGNLSRRTQVTAPV